MGNILSLKNNYNNFIKSYFTNDIYHLPAYLKLEASLKNAKSIYWKSFKLKDKCIIPLIKQKINNSDKYNLISPYGYSGILINLALSSKEISEILKEFNSDDRKEGYFSTFICLNPLNNTWKYITKGNIKQIFYGSTVCIPLSADIKHIQSSFSINHKN